MVACVLIYMAVAACAIGALTYTSFANSPEPLALILRELQHPWAARYLAISANPLEASVTMRQLASDAGVVLTPTLDLFDARNTELARRGIDLERIVFSSSFGRGMDYYTGFVFELRDGEGDEPLVAGGRYDDLLTRLGSPTPIPAVGFAVWIERVMACGAAA